MKPADIIGLLDLEFADKIKAKKPDALDPFVVVESPDLVEICHFLRHDQRLRQEPERAVREHHVTAVVETLHRGEVQRDVPRVVETDPRDETRYLPGRKSQH